MLCTAFRISLHIALHALLPHSEHLHRRYQFIQSVLSAFHRLQTLSRRRTGARRSLRQADRTSCSVIPSALPFSKLSQVCPRPRCPAMSTRRPRTPPMSGTGSKKSTCRWHGMISRMMSRMRAKSLRLARHLREGHTTTPCSSVSAATARTPQPLMVWLTASSVKPSPPTRSSDAIASRAAPASRARRRGEAAARGGKAPRPPPSSAHPHALLSPAPQLRRPVPRPRRTAPAPLRLPSSSR